jgi:hypothetical protein
MESGNYSTVHCNRCVVVDVMYAVESGLVL